MALRLKSNTLELVAATAELAHAEWTDRKRFALLLDAGLPGDWPPPLTEDRLEPNARRLREHPQEAGWWFWYFVLCEGPSRTAIGCAGFGGPPDPEGRIQLGYSVIPAHHGRGYATEAVNRLVEWAFEKKGVAEVIAETFPELIASIRVLEKSGFALVGEGNEPGVIRYAQKRGGGFGPPKIVNKTAD